MKSYSFFLIVFIIISVEINAQVLTQYFSADEHSPKAQKAISLAKKCKVYKMPSFDLRELLKEDSIISDLDVPYRFGKGFDVSLSIEDGTWLQSEGGRIWVINLSSGGGVFSKFHI